MTKKGLGSESEVATIELIEGGVVHTINQLGARRTMPLLSTRGKGLLPVVGETWVIEKTFGRWALSSCAKPNLSEITGSVEEGTVMADLLAALAASGLIVDSVDRTIP